MKSLREEMFRFKFRTSFHVLFWFLQASCKTKERSDRGAKLEKSDTSARNQKKRRAPIKKMTQSTLGNRNLEAVAAAEASLF
jgi:hypothetical protein